MYVLGVAFQALTDGCVNPDKDVMAVRPHPAQKIVASITSRCSEGARASPPKGEERRSDSTEWRKSRLKKIVARLETFK